MAHSHHRLPADAPRHAPDRRPAPPRRAPDVHELMKAEAYADEGAPSYAPTGVPMPGRPAADHRPAPRGVSDQYIVLDSFLKLRESAVGRGEFRWNFMVQGVSDAEVVGVRDKVDTVIEIQMGAFSMPHLEEVPYITVSGDAYVDPHTPSGLDRVVLIANNDTVATAPTLVPNATPYGQYPAASLVPSATSAHPWVHNPYTQTPCGGRFTVQIREAGLQSYSDRGGARHHFEFTMAAPLPGANPNMLLAAPQLGTQWDTFTFTEPLQDVHGITLIFRNPDIPLRFEPDCFYDVAMAPDAAGAPGPYLSVAAPSHGLCMGDRIFISGYRSGVDALDAHVNRPQGHVAAGAPATPLPPGALIVGDAFWTDPAISTVDMSTAISAQRVTVCVAKRRLRIPVRLRRVVDRRTNYISI